VRLTNRGQPAHIVVPLSNITSYVLFANKDNPIDGIAGLKGKKIGITSPGSKTDGLVRLALRRAGLDADKDATILGIGGAANNMAAIEAKRIDAGMVSGVEVGYAEQKFSTVFDWRKFRTASIALIGLDSWTKANPDLVRRFTVATLKGAQMAAQDRALAEATLIRLFPNFDPQVVRANTDQLLSVVMTGPRFSEDEFKSMQDDTLALEPDLKPISYGDFNPDFTAK
jgi:NitT/TauT family transport system substrate-binding protein